MNENVKKAMDKINYCSLTINECSKSLDFILKDMEEAERLASGKGGADYRGLANIVEQLSHRIHIEAGIIINLSDSVNYAKLKYCEDNE